MQECKLFTEGKCTRGSHCRYLHSAQATPTPTNIVTSSSTATSSNAKRQKTTIQSTVQVRNELLACTTTTSHDVSLRNRPRKKVGARKPRKSIAEMELSKESKLLSLTACIVNKGVNVLNNVNLTTSELAVLSCGFLLSHHLIINVNG